MAAPIRNRLDFLDLVAHRADAMQPSRGTHDDAASAAFGLAAPDNDDLQRVESSIDWLKRACVSAACEARSPAGDRTRRLPRAAQLSPLLQAAPVEGERAAGQSTVLDFEPAPPRACERLQPASPDRPHGYELRGLVGILVAGILAGSIAYHISAGGSFAATGAAQAAAPRPR